MTSSRITRRALMVSATAAAALAAGSLSVSAMGSPRPFPLSADLADGDLLWPKMPGVFVPYNYRGELTALGDQARWESGRDAFLARTDVTMDNVVLVNRLETMTYAGFRAAYLNGATEGQLLPYAYGPASMVGHVAMVRRAGDGTPFVVEAVPDRGVHAISYGDWIGERPGEVVWHGRIRDLTEEQRRAVADAAYGYLTAPYDFFILDLDDEAGFYCSKLVWLAVMRAAAVALDGNPEPDRWFWLSPKQLLNAPAVEVLLDQGDYAFD